MADIFSPEKRSEIMSRIRSSNTKPELLVRSLVHGMGYRYRLHKSNLPGRPDMVFTPRKKIIFIHGCFWHQHSCQRGRMPKTRRSYWETKLNNNVARDAMQKKMLEDGGWEVMTVWECQTKDLTKLAKRLKKFLD